MEDIQNIHNLLNEEHIPRFDKQNNELSLLDRVKIFRSRCHLYREEAFDAITKLCAMKIYEE